MEIIQNNLQKLKILCDNHFVKKLYVFGSVVSNSFTDESDIDFLVSFEGVEPLNYFDNYMDFKESLEELFKKDIDLIENQTLKKPALKRSFERNKILVYGREDSKVAV